MGQTNLNRQCIVFINNIIIKQYLLQFCKIVVLSNKQIIVITVCRLWGMIVSIIACLLQPLLAGFSTFFFLRWHLVMQLAEPYSVLTLLFAAL